MEITLVLLFMKHKRQAHKLLFLNQECASLQLARAWFLELTFVQDVSMFVFCVYVRPQGHKKLLA